MFAHVEPAPTDEEREAILVALDSPAAAARNDGGWAVAALLEGVDDESELDHP